MVNHEEPTVTVEEASHTHVRSDPESGDYNVPCDCDNPWLNDLVPVVKEGKVIFPTSPDSDPVNHPAHYTNLPNGIECIEVTKYFNFCLGNAIKYIWRADHKNKKREDLLKAIWYIQKEIDELDALDNPYQSKG